MNVISEPVIPIKLGAIVVVIYYATCSWIYNYL